MDEGVWRATVHGVAKSWTRLRGQAHRTLSSVECGVSVSTHILFAGSHEHKTCTLQNPKVDGERNASPSVLTVVIKWES